MSKAKGIAAGIVGMNRAYKAASQSWKDDAYATLVQVISKGVKEVTTDPIWLLNPLLDNGTEPRAMGGVMTLARKNGLIKTIPGKFEHSTREVNHSRYIQVWRVL